MCSFEVLVLYSSISLQLPFHYISEAKYCAFYIYLTAGVTGKFSDYNIIML